MTIFKIVVNLKKINVKKIHACFGVNDDFQNRGSF